MRHPILRLTPRSVFVSVLMLIAYSSSTVHAQEDPTGRFVQVPDGTLDTTTGLVWGFAIMESFGTSTNWDWANDFYQDRYPGESASFVAATYPVEEYEAAYQQWYYEDWRLPSRDEMIEAVDAGLFLYHNIDMDAPLNSKIDQAAPSSNGHWSGTSKGNRAYTVNLWFANATLSGKTSALNCLPVRGGTPDSGTGGNGNGKGNGKGKNK